MRRDTRLSRMLHVMLHMARHPEPLSSDQIASMLGTNPVVVRRTMADLRRAGYLRSEKGHGGGWAIARDLGEVTLLDIHRALGGATVFAIGNDSGPSDCLVETIVNNALDDALERAEAILIERLGAIRLADLASEFDASCSASDWDASHPIATSRRAIERSGDAPDIVVELGDN